MRKVITLSALTLLFQGTLACDDEEETGDSDEDADTDTDADADTDSDVDTDTDVDTGPTDADGDGWTIAGGDCDDTDPAVHPEADEVVGDGVDQDCDGTEVCYEDGDADGYGASATTVSMDLDCTDAGEAAFGTDCDDGDPTVQPGAAETCGDGIDQDCNGADLRCEGWGDINLSSADAMIIGDCRGSGVGETVDVGDVDGDGFEDIVVGAQGSSIGGTYVGAAYLVLGPVSGEVDHSTADAVLVGEDSYWGTCAEVTAGDTNGDGFEDIIASGFMFTSGTGSKSPGGAYLVLGPVSGDVGLSTADAKLIGGDPDLRAGRSLASGDVNGDAVSDILIGAPGSYSSHQGSVYLIHGPTSGTHNLSEADAELVGEGGFPGEAVAVGDTNGDGFEDIIVGASLDGSTGTHAGAAFLVLGPASGTIALSDADARLLAEHAGDRAGGRAATGDMDGDGLDDILVGAGLADVGGHASGAVYLLLGPVSGEMRLSRADAVLIGEGGDTVGEVSAGDIDGDGIDDILIGSGNIGPGGGGAYIVFAPVSGDVDLSTADARLLAEEVYDGAGTALAAGDTDGDGAEDILVGAPGADDYYGALYLILGGGS